MARYRRLSERPPPLGLPQRSDDLQASRPRLSERNRARRCCAPGMAEHAQVPPDEHLMSIVEMRHKLLSRAWAGLAILLTEDAMSQLIDGFINSGLEVGRHGLGRKPPVTSALKYRKTLR
jgi:hypothetical protein